MLVVCLRLRRPSDNDEGRDSRRSMVLLSRTAIAFAGWEKQSAREEREQRERERSVERETNNTV